MPFKSKAQRRLMYAKHPRIAKHWSKKYKTSNNLPEKKSKKEAVWTVKNSQLHGHGLFSNKVVKPGQTIVKAAQRQGGKDGLDRYEITFATRYTNHADAPNARLKKVASGRVEIVATQPIEKGAEVLVDYRRTRSAFGPGSYMTYRGAVRATKEDLEKQAAGYFKFAAKAAPEPYVHVQGATYQKNWEPKTWADRGFTDIQNDGLGNYHMVDPGGRQVSWEHETDELDYETFGDAIGHPGWRDADTGYAPIEYPSGLYDDAEKVDWDAEPGLVPRKKKMKKKQAAGYLKFAQQAERAQSFPTSAELAERLRRNFERRQQQHLNANPPEDTPGEWAMSNGRATRGYARIAALAALGLIGGGTWAYNKWVDSREEKKKKKMKKKSQAAPQPQQPAAPQGQEQQPGFVPGSIAAQALTEQSSAKDKALFTPDAVALADQKKNEGQGSPVQPAPPAQGAQKMSSSHIAPGNPANGPTGPVFRALETVRHKLAANFHTPESWEREEDDQEAHAKSVGVDYKRTKMAPGTVMYGDKTYTDAEYEEQFGAPRGPDDPRFKILTDDEYEPPKRRRKGAPRTTTRTRVRRDGKKGKSTITTRSRPGKKMNKKSAINDRVKMENHKEAAAATARGVLSPVLLQRAMEKQGDLADTIKSTGEAVSGYWSRYVNAMKGGTIANQIMNPEKAKFEQLLALAGTGVVGGGALGMLNQARKKKEDRDLLGGGFTGGVLGGLGGLGIGAYGPNRLAKQMGLSKWKNRPDLY